MEEEEEEEERPSRGLCFIGRGPGEGAAGVRNRLSSPERLMVASRCFIIFSKCKFVHGTKEGGGRAPRPGGFLI